MDNVIKAFLVSIGLAVDEASAKKAEATINRVEEGANKAERSRTKIATEQASERAKQAAREQKAHEQSVASLRSLANTALATAALIQTATLAFAGYASTVAQKLEAMAYASDRTRSSIMDLKVFAQSVSQLGGTSGGALNDLENFAEKLRSNPQGYTAFLKSVGVEAKDAQGNLRGAAQLYKEFRANVGRKPYEQQMLYAGEMGVSEQTWRATDPAKMAAQEAAQRAKYARLGYDPDKAKQDAIGLETAVRDMWDSISIIGEKAASKIFGDVGGNLKSFTKFIEDHGDEIAEMLSKVTQLVLAFTRALLELATSEKAKAFLDGLLASFGHVDEATGKWTADTEKIQKALEALAAFVATVFVSKILGGFGSILKAAKPLLALLGVLGIGGGIGVGAAVGSAIGADAAVPNADKPALQNHWDDEASGAAGGAGIGGVLKRGVGAVKRALGIGTGSGIGHLASKADRAAYIRESAKRNGIDPEIALRVAMSEGFNKYDGDPDATGKPTSFGDFQLHYPSIGRNTAGGLGTQFTRETGLDARDPKTWKEQIDFAMKVARKHGWGDWHGAQAKHIGNHEGIGVAAATAANVVAKAGEAVSRLDANKMRAIGAATQGFDPSKYFLTAPSLGTSTTNDNSSKQQSYKGGDTHVAIHTSGDVRETAELWRRHGERQKADDVRYAASMFA